MIGLNLVGAATKNSIGHWTFLMYNIDQNVAQSTQMERPDRPVNSHE